MVHAQQMYKLYLVEHSGCVVLQLALKAVHLWALHTVMCQHCLQAATNAHNADFQHKSYSNRAVTAFSQYTHIQCMSCSSESVSTELRCLP